MFDLSEIEKYYSLEISTNRTVKHSCRTVS